MKFKRLLKECPILIAITVVAVVLSIVGLCFRSTVYAQYAGGEEPFKYPALSYVFQGARDGVYPWSEPDMEENVNSLFEAGTRPGDEETADEGLEVAEGDGSAEVEAEGGEDTEGASEEAEQDDSSFDISGNSAEEPEEEEPEFYEFTDVDDDYFNDALFIGDSRTVGLSEYCEPLDTRATFYSKVSLTIYACMDKEFIQTDNGKISVDQALRENEFGKIYIMLGINEIGTGDAQYFKDAYEEVINRIRELQPDAIIYIQGIMHVTAHKSDNDKYFNNDNINERNAAIAELADNRTVFYIDMNGAVDDGNGNLDSTLTFDDVHLKASSYERWHEFLLHNAIVR
jgi:hypothetical protein